MSSLMFRHINYQVILISDLLSWPGTMAPKLFRVLGSAVKDLTHAQYAFSTEVGKLRVRHPL